MIRDPTRNASVDVMSNGVAVRQKGKKTRENMGLPKRPVFSMPKKANLF
jgi:hypothetical protein